MLDKRLRCMLLHVFKSLKGINAKCLKDVSSVKQLNYSMRQAATTEKKIHCWPQIISYDLYAISFLGYYENFILKYY